MSKYTEGPWSLNAQYAEIEVRGPEESGVLIAVMSPWGVAADGPNPQAANARLIASAPDLLAALVGCVEVMERMYGNPDAPAPKLIAAKAAIDKATRGAA